jgi:nucleotide-binding universal stress UspA family protein
MTSNILCATDGESASDILITFAAKLAAKLGAKLSIIAVNVLLYNARGGSSYRWTDEKLDEILEDAVKTAAKAGVPAAQIVRAVGTYPASIIIEHAEKNGFDHIVVGNPRVGVARLILGSVASEVAAKAHCPVTVAR